MDSAAEKSSESADRPIALAFHKLTNRITYGINNCPPAKFRRIIDYLQSHGIEPDKLLITFDDGYAHLYENLRPLMEWYRLRPLIFVPTGYIGQANRWDYSSRIVGEKHLSVEQIKELHQAGARFGSHGLNHLPLTKLPLDAVRVELQRSKEQLEGITGEEVTDISYPFGRCDDTVLELAREIGYRHGYTTRFPATSDTPLAFGRYPVYRFDRPGAVYSKVAAAGSWSIHRTIRAWVSLLSRGTMLHQRFS